MKTLDFIQQAIGKKDYEILSFSWKRGQITLVIPKSNDNRFTNGFDHFSEEELIKDKQYTIYSVRRLSDGEVFTLGDDFCLSPCTRTYTISSFSIDGNLLYINSNNDYPVTIPRLIKKRKKPLFTTDQEHYIKYLIKKELNEIAK